MAALLVLALLALSRAEALVAEVHDGDATHAELVQVDGVARHDAAHGAGHHDDGSHTRSAATDASDDASGHHDAPGHPYHACHHTHAHADAAWRAVGAAFETALVAVRPAAPAARAQAFRSRAVEPQLRPPIA